MLICGCMFSGKTTELLERIRSQGPTQVLVIKHGRDDRYAARKIVAHGQDSQEAWTVWESSEIPDLLKPEHRMVAIDEGHFFDAELPAICKTLAKLNVHVVITSLDLNSWGEPFAVIESVKAVADRCVVREARCNVCNRPASRTQRLTPIIDGQIVGGPEAFEPRCSDCWTPPPEQSVDHA